MTVEYISLILNLGGEYEEIKSFCGKYFSNMEGEDTTVASFKFTGGHLGLLIYSWSIKNPPKVPAFEIYGEKGSVYPWRNLSSNSATGTPLKGSYTFTHWG